MEPIDYLRVLRRRWAVIVVLGVLGAAIAVLTTPSRTASGPQSYQATATLLANASAPPGTPSLPQAALYLTTGDVPTKVAAEIGFKGDPAALAAKITGTADTTVNDLKVTAISPNGANAAQIANAFADQLVASLQATATSAYQQQVNTVQARLNQLTSQINALDQKIGSQTATEDPVDSAQRTALTNQYSLSYDQFQQLAAQGPPGPAFTILQHAVPVPASSGSFRAPTSRKVRLAIGLLAGLVLGAGLVLVLDRIDPRIRSKEDAEEAFGYPVIAEVPALPRSRQRAKELETILRPGSPFAESHRILRTLLLLSRPPAVASGNGSARPLPADPRLILVISAGPSEGKTTTVAHLAVAFAEAGRSVLILSCDFHRPRVHEMFDVAEGRGLTDVLSTPGMELADVVQVTAVRGVSLVPSGSPVSNPAALIGHDHRFLDAARELADIVLIDTAPVLVANDASELMPAADAVVVVARAGKATRPAAQRASDLLNRVGAAVVGVVLTAAPSAPTNEQYYYNRYYVRHEGVGGWRRYLGRRPPQEPEGPAPVRVVPRVGQEFSDGATSRPFDAASSSTSQPERPLRAGTRPSGVPSIPPSTAAPGTTHPGSVDPTTRRGPTTGEGDEIPPLEFSEADEWLLGQLGREQGEGA